MAEPMELERIALLNFGGIGDEILFSPVVHAVRQALPDAHMTLVLEARSGRIRELLPQIDATVEVELQKLSRGALFFRLLKILRGRHFDAVISSGSSPFIALLLWCSGIPVRIGYDSGSLSRKLLTQAAPLNRKAYAGEMYYSLARCFLQTTQLAPEEPTGNVTPQLSVDTAIQEKARGILKSAGETEPPKQRILIHPGVSQMSIRKNIFKSWPLAYWEQLIVQLLQQYAGASIYLAGGPDDADVLNHLNTFCQGLAPGLQPRVINLYGKTTSLKDLAGIISLCDLLISVDSAPMHLAIGLQTPVVALFSPTDEKKLVPQTQAVAIAARPDLACRPCLWDVRKTSCNNPICLEIPVSTVLGQVEMVLRQSEQVPSVSS